MNDTWDLSILYKGFDDPAFTGDMAALDAAIRSMNDLAAQAAALPPTPPCATPWPPSTIWTPSSTPTPPWRSIAICCGTSAGTASTSCPTRRRSCSPG